jgi:hypothetical protein
MGHEYKVDDILKYKESRRNEISEIGYVINGKPKITVDTTFKVINVRKGRDGKNLYDIQNQQDKTYIIKGQNGSDISDVYEKVLDGGGRKLRKSKKNRKSKRNVRKNRKSSRNYY